MTKKQIENYNWMLHSLKRIASGYETVSKIRRNSQRQYGLSFIDALEMSYENIQEHAKVAAKGIRKIKNK